MFRPALAVLALALAACNGPEHAPDRVGTPVSSGPGDVRPAPGFGVSADGDAPPRVAPSATGRGDEDAEDQTVRLSFAPGASRATAQDTLGGAALHDYLVRGAAGQTLTASLVSDGPPLVLIIDDRDYDPDQVRQVDAETNQDTPGGWLWRGTLPYDGDYRVRVAHSGPAANGGSWSPYALTVEIE